jgi:uncharacterized protein YegJ (DUF2314 family)
MKKSHVIFLVLLAIPNLIGCGKQERDQAKVVERSGEPDVIYVKDDDPKMAEAMKKARTTVDQFIQALKQPKSTQSGFSVKTPIRDGDSTEYMWLNPVSFRNGKFVGKINNEPDTVTTVKLGDEITIEKDGIADWMYIDNRKLVGGYSIRVLRDMTPKEKRAEFDRGFPFILD